jgi:hypothetical protein
MADQTVRLTFEETQYALFIGACRNAQNWFRGAQDKHGAVPENASKLNMDGVIGEIALAKWGDRYWNGALGDYTAGDVGTWQVRYSVRPDARLILHPSDKDDAPFFLVTGVPPVVTLRGWIMGRDGKQQEYWTEPGGNGRPAYFVPQSKLKPMPDRAAILKRRGKERE